MFDSAVGDTIKRNASHSRGQRFISHILDNKLFKRRDDFHKINRSTCKIKY